jgi:Carboxypeptidase regulatory-like domain/Prealbumin-like fold domain
VKTSTGIELPGVTLTLTGDATATATSDGYGQYTFAGLYDGSYTITAAAVEGYTITPATKTVTVNGANVTGQDFVGTSYRISGRVKSKAGLPMANVTVMLNGEGITRTTRTDPAGRYTFTPLGNGTYTVTPSKTGKVFTPASRTVTIDGANMTGQNFKGKKQ